MTSIYLYNNGGEARGPFSADTIKYWLERGACTPEDLAWSAEHNEWRPLSSFGLDQPDPKDECPWHLRLTNNLPFASLAIGLVMGFLETDSSRSGAIVLAAVVSHTLGFLAAQVLFGRLLALPIAPIVMALGKRPFKTAFRSSFAVISVVIVGVQTLALGLRLAAWVLK
jgi:hypothetical protein